MKYENYEEVKRLVHRIDKYEKDLDLYQNIESRIDYFYADMVIYEENEYGDGVRTVLKMRLDYTMLERFANEQIEKLKADIEECKAKIEKL